MICIFYFAVFACQKALFRKMNVPLIWERLKFQNFLTWYIWYFWVDWLTPNDDHINLFQVWKNGIPIYLYTYTSRRGFCQIFYTCVTCDKFHVCSVYITQVKCETYSIGLFGKPLSPPQCARYFDENALHHLNRMIVQNKKYQNSFTDIWYWILTWLIPHAENEKGVFMFVLLPIPGSNST